MPINPPVPIYQSYFQKSRTFLFPLLELKRKGLDVFLPAQTYLGIKGLYKPYDHKLICSYDNPHDPAWTAYQQKHLLSHRLLENSVELSGGYKLLFIFDLAPHAADVDHFLAGRYSQLSADFKKHVCTYFGVQSAEWAQVEGFLYPEVAIPRYAKQLGYSQDEFRASLEPHGELCARFDPEQETLCAELTLDFVENMILS